MRINKTIRLLEYLLAICIILEFNTVYLIFPIIKRLIQILPVLILICLILLNRKGIPQTGRYITLYVIGCIFPLFSLNDNVYISYFLRYVLFIPLLWIYISQRKEMGREAYLSMPLRFSDMTTIFAGISLVFWVICSVMNLVSPTMMIPYDWAPNIFSIPSFYNVYFETQRANVFGEMISRNSGIFNEGPMHNMILCTAFTIEYFIRPQKSKRRITILILAILSTLTTTGQFFLIAIAIWHIYTKVGRKHRILMLLILPIILMATYTTTNAIMEAKKSTINGESSISSRTEDIQYCFEIGMQNPIMGIGIIPTENDVTWRGERIGSSNSFFAVFARGGLYILTLYVVALFIIPLLYYRKYKDTNWIMAMLCYLGLFTVTACYLNLLTLFFIAWGLSNINLKCPSQLNYYPRTKY